MATILVTGVMTSAAGMVSLYRLIILVSVRNLLAVELLSKNILTNAKRDELQKLKNLLEKDRVVLNKIRKCRDPIREIFEASCDIKGMVPKMSMDKFSNSLFDRLVICDKKVSPTPQVAGDEVPEFKVTLSMADSKNAFVAMGTGDADADSLTFDDFMIALCLCGSFKYAEVKVPTEDDPEKTEEAQPNNPYYDTIICYWDYISK